MLHNSLVAQERTVGLLHNLQLATAKPVTQKKTRALTLPFVDDFSATEIVPNINNWQGKNVYINNTFSIEPITKGMATFDALDSVGNPYYPTGALSKFYADTLTSQAIDLQGKTAADSIYLSFFYQPQGLGFSPEPTDSFCLFFLTNANAWVKMWSAPGSVVQDWKQQMIAVTANNFLHNNFQFRFVNIASPGINNDVWNLDYVKLGANRTKEDTILGDVAFTAPPSSIFSKYTAMPARHFLSSAGEQAGNFQAYMRNNGIGTSVETVLANATQLPSNSVIYSGIAALNIFSNASETADYSFYNLSTQPNTTTEIIHTYFRTNNIGGGDLKSNDTIRSRHVMGNYFAYDDGSAEKAYYLNAAPNTPGSLALAFHLNIPDSLQGLAIQFGAQVPSALGKTFSLILYKSLGNTTLTQQILKQQDAYTVQYATAKDGFVQYKFNDAIFLDSGTYYIGTMQPTNSGSDTIYFGLDANHSTNLDYLFYNVDGTWQPSTAIGSILLRPIVGNTFVPTNVNNMVKPKTNLHLYPNPSEAFININCSEEYNAMQISNYSGATVQKLNNKHTCLDISKLPVGAYQLYLLNNRKPVANATFIKK